MGLIAELVSAVPAAAKYRAALDKMEQENERLKLENAELKTELSQYIEKWETLDGDAVKTLQHLARGEFASAEAIARTHQMNVQITEMYLHFLIENVYVAAPAKAGERAYALTSKGRRYLLGRDLL